MDTQQNAIVDTISGTTIHPHMDTGHTNEGRKERQQTREQEREEVVNEEWVAMTNGTEVVKYASTQLPQVHKDAST